MDSTGSHNGGNSFFKAYSLEITILVAALLVSSTMFVSFNGVATTNQAILTRLQAAPAGGAAPSAGSGAAAQAPGPTDPNTLSFASIDVAPVGVSDRPIRGSADAKVTIVEFSDFQCPYCQRAVPIMDSALSEQSGKVNLVYRHYNAAGHPLADKAGEAFECAVDQGKTWEYHDKLFEVTPALEVTQLKQYAVDLGLSAATFNTCLDSGAKAAAYQADRQLAGQYGVSGTPGFMLIGGDADRIDKAPLAQFKDLLTQSGGEMGIFKTSDNKVVITFSGALPYQYFKPVLEAQIAAAG
ncbi:MAG: DsbA family protein [Candidatus Micrarchaeota archaeon]|nr:DsbA family protein [Candidatus Micrarchaeota archaeon]